MSFNINSAIQSCTDVLIGSSNYSTWARQVYNLLTMATWWNIISGTSTHAAQPDAASQTTWDLNDKMCQCFRRSITRFLAQLETEEQENAQHAYYLRAAIEILPPKTEKTMEEI